MDLNQLRYFVAVAEHGSFSAAARAIKVSQPALSAAVGALEKDLGTTLLLRQRDGIVVTSSGDELLVRAAELFTLLTRTREVIRGLQDDDVGSFVVGCHESLGAYFLPGFVPDFLRAAPGIQITLANAPSAEVTRGVVAREIQFGLVVNPLPHPDLVLVELFRDAMDVVVASGGARGKSDVKDAHARLRAGPLLFAARVAQCQELLSRLAADGLAPERRLACGDLELVKALALAGVGPALLPRRVAAYGQPGKLRRLHPTLPYIQDTIYLAFRGDAHRTAAMLRVKDALIAHGRRLAAVTPLA